MFNIFDELRLGMAANEEQKRFEREAKLRLLLREAHTQRDESRKERGSFAEFFALAFRALGTNGHMSWKL